MNKSNLEIIDFVDEVNKELSNITSVEFGVCAPSVYLQGINKDGILNIGAQNMHFEDSGAFTGEVSADMLNDVGAHYVIIGHSERRQYFNETDETVNLKLIKAIDKGLVPIVCCGETLEEYESGKTKDVVRSQIEKAFKNVKSLDGIIVAYEPIWAIGTGLSATSEGANEMCKYIREVLAQLYGDASEIVIQYGGSVKPNNIGEYLGMSDIDGALVGGASVLSSDFISLISAIA